MAIAFVANRAAVTSAAVGFTEPLDMPVAGSITVGNTLFLYIATDNTGQLPNVTGVSDPRGNFWTRVSNTTINPGADLGASVELWVSRVQFAYTNGDDLTVSWDQNISRGAFLVNEFSGIAPRTDMTAVTGTGTGTTIGSLATSPTIGQMVIGVAAIESNVAITGDADTTNGSWSTIATQTSNSGTDATSITVATQHKITTGSGAQNWAATKVGASDWAALSVVVPIQTLTSPTIPAGNPNYPCIAGYEGLPTKGITVPLDTGTGYAFTIDDAYIYPNAVDANSIVAYASLETPRDGLSQHTIAFDLGFPDSMHVEDDQVLTVFAALNGATTDGSARDANGVNIPAPTPAQTLAVLAQPGEGYLRLDSPGIVGALGESVQFTIDGAALAARYPGMRIARMGLRYIAWKDDTTLPDPSIGMNVQWVDPRNNLVGRDDDYVYGQWLVNNYRSTSTYEYRSMGEINHIPPAPAGVFQDSDARGWVIGDLSAMNLLGTGPFISIYANTGTDTTQTTIFFDYIEVVLDLVPERRRGSAAVQVTNIPFVVDNSGYVGSFANPAAAFFDVSGGGGTTPMGFPASSDGWTLVVREALPADGSDALRARQVDPLDPLNVPAMYTGAEAVGVPMRLQALTNVRATQDPAPEMELVTEVSTRPTSFETIEEYIPAVSMAPLTLIVSDGYIWPQFQTMGIPSEQRVTNGTTQTQYVLAAATQYSYLRVLVKTDPTMTSGNTLNFSIEQPLATVLTTASVTVGTIEAQPDLGEGWREVRVPLAAPITPAAGQVAIVMSTTVNGAAFEIAGSYPKTTNSGYNNSAPNDDTRPTDSSVALVGTYATPTVSLGTQEITWINPDNYVGNNYGVCRSLSYDVPTVTWGRTGGCTGFDQYVVERSTDGGSTWEVAFKDNGTGAGADNFAPLDISPTVRQFIYRVSAYRDILPNYPATVTSGNWGGTSVSPGPVIVLSSSSVDLWFTPVTEGMMELKWTPLSPVTMIQLHGQDKQYPLRGTEDRGLSLSVPVLVNQTYLCSPLTGDNLVISQAMGEVVDNGRYAMSPRTFEELIVPIMRSSDLFKMKLPGGHTRWVTVEIGDMTVTTQSGAYIAELIITDVTAPSDDPYVDDFA